MEVLKIVSSLLKISALASYIVLVIMTMRSKSTTRVKVYFSIYLSGMIFWQFGSLMVNFSNDRISALFWYNLIFSGSGLFSVLFFPFTRAFLAIKRQRAMRLASFVVCVFVIACGILGIPFSSVVSGKSGYFVPLLDNYLVGIVGLIPIFFWGQGVVNLIRGLLKKQSLMQKNRIRYVLTGSIIMIFGAASNVTDLKDYPIDIVCNLVNAALIGYAVVRHRLLDIRTFFLRSINYTIISGVLIGGYVLLILFLENVIIKLTGNASPLVNVFLILGLVFILLPVRNRLQTFIDRLFLRTTYDYRDTIQKFSTDINSFHNIEDVLSHIIKTVYSTMKIDTVFISLFEHERNEYRLALVGSESGIAASPDGPLVTVNLRNHLLKERYPVLKDEILINPRMHGLSEDFHVVFENQAIQLIVPFILKDELIGTIHCGEKMSGAVYSEEDLKFLMTLANQSSTAIDNAMIYSKIERRLAVQTLLFILSETFRGSKSFDDIMFSVVKILSDFLTFSYCGLVSFEQPDKVSIFSSPEFSDETKSMLETRTPELIGKIESLLEDTTYLPVGNGEIDQAADAMLKSAICVPLRQNRQVFGFLVMPNMVTGHRIEDVDMELLRTIQAIISQGIMLHRTIINLINMKAYNEKIIDGMNRIGDALVIVDLDGRIRNSNQAMCTLLEFEREELIGMEMTAITNVWSVLFNRDRMELLTGQGSVSNYELPYRTKSGNVIPMLFSGSIIYNETGRIEGILGIARDISTRKQAEEAHKKELLLKEIHHRVKNNLQVVSSLLSLQASYTRDENVKTIFKESQSRIRSMALIHENLYLSRDLAGIDFNGYVKDLVNDLFYAYDAAGKKIALDIDLPEDVSLNMHQAVPCGLIINELVTNSLKYAFPDGRGGTVFIRLEIGNGPACGSSLRCFTLTVGDDGIGMPYDYDPENARSLGLKLVFTLTKQLDGEMEVKRGNGTVFNLKINEGAVI